MPAGDVACVWTPFERSVYRVALSDLGVTAAEGITVLAPVTVREWRRVRPVRGTGTGLG